VGSAVQQIPARAWDPPRYISIREAGVLVAWIFGRRLSRSALYRAVDRGAIPTIRLGGRVLCDKTRLLDAISQGLGVF